MLGQAPPWAARAPAVRAALFRVSRPENARLATEKGKAGAGAALLPRVPRRRPPPAARSGVAPRERAARSERNAQARRVSCSKFQLPAFQRITRGAPCVIGFSAKPATFACFKPATYRGAATRFCAGGAGGGAPRPAAAP